MAEFVAAMRQLRIWADLSYRQLERNAEAAGDVLPRATIAGALSRDDLPREQLLTAFVRACGGDAETVAVWLAARRHLSIAASASPPTAVSAATMSEADPALTSAPTPDPAPDAAPASGAAASGSEASGAAARGSAASGLPVSSGAALDAEPRPAEAAPLPEGAAPADPDERSHEISRPADTTASGGASIGASGSASGEGGKGGTGSSWRRRYLPPLVVAAAAAVGVLLLTYWPHSGSDDGALPDGRSRTSTGPSAGEPSGAGPSTGSASPSKSGKSVVDADDTQPASPTRTASSPPEREPTATTTAPEPADKPRLPAAGPTRIRPVSASGLCLTEGRERNGRTDREIAVQSPCADAPLPRVSLDALGGGVYRIEWYHPDPDKGTGCLAVDGGSAEPGTLISPRSCSDADNMKFRLEASHGGFRLRPLHSGLCVGIMPPRTEGAEAVQATCTGAADQAFRFTAA
ncbi:hypothetical protein SPAR_15438 [Streptomyces sparsogenes DSM 40356]|uniref:Uncharacterized protein n=1 Tax=Streptomyces sparsogenes DSM 40356 TaxID=1331668 RepID=A0A1R1SJT6_9ACTN|nr:hypothetical protein SPAR_15438 [Streptomyces sparsogenes DSM 40356]